VVTSRESGESEKAAPADVSVQTTEESYPMLPSDFYIQLLNPPACITKNLCDGCGRCEH
jgi:hypothetical protein